MVRPELAAHDLWPSLAGLPAEARFDAMRRRFLALVASNEADRDDACGQLIQEELDLVDDELLEMARTRLKTWLSLSPRSINSIAQSWARSAGALAEPHRTRYQRALEGALHRLPVDEVAALAETAPAVSAALPDEVIATIHRFESHDDQLRHSAELRRRQGATARIRQAYPQPHTLRSGRTLRLELMGRGDDERLLEFARALPRNDLLYLPWDMTEESVVAEWLAQIRRREVLTLLALDGDEVVGELSLVHGRAHWTRHLGEIRVNVAQAARGGGLGRHLIDRAFGLAAEFGLRRLVATMVVEQVAARSLFAHLGFEVVAQLPGYVTDRTEAEHDLIVTMARVTEHTT